MLSLAFVACDKDNYEYVPENNDPEFGILSFAGMNISTSKDLDVITRAETDNYLIYIYNSNNVLHNGEPYIYKNVMAGENASIALPEGTYKIEVRSASDIPEAAFETPIYGATKENVAVVAGDTTPVGEILCTLLQCKVSVEYNDDFLEMVAGDCSVEVNIIRSNGDGSLTFPLTYNNGKPTYKKENGFFKVNNGEDTTMEVKFSGTMLDDNGNTATQRMTKAFDNIAPKQWRQIKFIKKVNEEGNATFDITIDDLIEDNPLGEDPSAEGETSIGEDPNKPQGDGGITLLPADNCDFEDIENMTIPDYNTNDASEDNDTPMVLTMTANVPNGVRKFKVTISSDNDDFMDALDVVGGPIVDLVNPSALANGIFDIVPFPHGSELLGMTTVPFDLSAAQKPILRFIGTHTFVMTVVDNKGCTKDVTIKMIVPDYANSVTQD